MTTGEEGEAYHPVRTPWPRAKHGKPPSAPAPQGETRRVDAGPDALDPGFHGVGAPWIRGFMAFQLARLAPEASRVQKPGSRSAGRLAAKDRAHATAGLG